VDISSDVNKYLTQLTYTDHEEDKADDLQLSLDDREGIWLTGWLNTADAEKGAELSAVITAKNFNSDGDEVVLDCGVFKIDSVDGSGPPANATIKATSLPFTSTARTATHYKAWENIKLSAIAGEIAGKNGMALMYESAIDPLFERKEQNEISDIVFLRTLCKDAGISLKVSAGFIVLFDEEDYEQKPAVIEIKHGEANVNSYRFGTTANDTKYAKCHVSYTNPKTGKTIEYTYTPRDSDPKGQTLKINEMVKTREEARQLAMKRLRQKNKSEFQANFTLVGDVRLVAGVTVEVIGWGLFDGKYIVETATHRVAASGYTVDIKLRQVLEGY
jgi:phage protein D